MRSRTSPTQLLLVPLLALVALASTTPSGSYSVAPQERISEVRVEPDTLTLQVGERQQLRAQVLDAAGNPLENQTVIFYSLARQAVEVTPSGLVRAHQPGEYQIAALVPEQLVPGEPADRTGRYDGGIRTFVTVIVLAPPVTRIDVEVPTPIYAGSTVSVDAVATDASGARRAETHFEISSNNDDIVTHVGAHLVRAGKPGTATLSITAEGLAAQVQLEVVADPTASLELESDADRVRTGDVVQLRATALTSTGARIADMPIDLALEMAPDPARPDSVGAGAPAQITPSGRFVAEQPGTYTVVALAGDRVARRAVTVVPRDVGRDVELVGHAPIRDRVTADLWVWEGVDGRDYAVVGTWNAEGHAYFYDVTDPASMVLVDKVQVDARTVNDVKVSEDGRIAVISREGASNRRNGLVLLDVSNPRDVQILSRYDDQLTGGVHNIFVHRDHIYAVNNGRRVDVINIEDPRNPSRVARYETDSPGRSVHDVWVDEGIAYQAGRTDGLIVLDVGGGGMGGSPNRPVEMARIPQLTGWNHSAWPFRSPSTGKTYVIGGDEAFYTHPLAPEAGGILWREKLPSRAKGWLHFVDISDPADAREVARYQVPESGPHNYWVDHDNELLYIGHFDAGLRVVDISGDLLGDLYRQGREVARFYSDDVDGFIPNSPFVWGPQPHKGTIFFADFSSGLWAVRLLPRAGEAITQAEPAFAETEAEGGDSLFRIRVEPDAVQLRAGQSAQIDAYPIDATGQPAAIERSVIFFSRNRQAVSVTPEGTVHAHKPGTFEIVAMLPAESSLDPDVMNASDPGTRTVITVRVAPSPLAELRLRGVPEELAVGERVAVGATVTDANGIERDVRAMIEASDPERLHIVRHGPIFAGSANAHPFYRRERPTLYPGETSGLLEGVAPGTVTLRASDGGLSASAEIRVVPSAVARLELSSSGASARTGDVIRFAATARDDAGVETGARVRFALASFPDPRRADSHAAGAPAQILRDGRFVAEQPGLYTVIATAGPAVARRTIIVEPRDVAREVEFLGQGPVRDRVTSDLWVWEGVDGRDYAITGTWQAEGHAYFWDVTDPADIRRIAELQVDARTVNDVKVSQDGRIAVISREGASNRRNGFVILDVSDPRQPQILSRYDDQMTGGVHNVFVHEEHVYAINNGRRWDVVNIEDPRNPFRVARFESSIPGRSVHDVWVRDGIAFQAGNTEGTVVVDVGGGDAGGSPANPVEIGRLPQLTGWNHAVWPFYSRSTGKFYIIAGDESHPVNPRDPANIISVESGLVSRAMGWLHVIEFDDLDNPVEVARYRVPEAGPHNLWIDWDAEVMYVAYFNGGLRVVDVSGELVGDLYRQGREIAKFYSDDRLGYVPNTPFVWGPQPHKGSIFFSDFNSGLWAVRLKERKASE